MSIPTMVKAIAIDQHKLIKARTVLDRFGIVGCNRPYVVVEARAGWT